MIEPVALAPPVAAVPIAKAAVAWSLIEYPDLPAPYRPCEGSASEPDVIPNTWSPSPNPACAVPYLKSS